MEEYARIKAVMANSDVPGPRAVNLNVGDGEKLLKPGLKTICT
jgi:hypothetical protein